MHAENKKKAILKERAKILAAEEKIIADQHIEIVEFILAYEKYGIETCFVREIYPLKELTRLPSTPQFLPGIINVRGQILSVIDIKKFFDLPEKGLTDLNKVIILQDEKMEFGILADSISVIRKVPENEIQPSLTTLTGIREQYLKGITRDRIVILDGEKLLSDKTIIADDNKPE
jgi:purine-binding chemotaxis protein CheW